MLRKSSWSTAAVSCHRILVVDDYIPAARAISQLLRLDGHTVVTAFSADNLVDSAASFRPDIVLLDISLDGAEDGLVAAQWLRNEPRLERTVLVALTGRCDEDMVARATDAGFEFYLVKPVGWDDLQAVIAAVDDDRVPGRKDNSIAG
jgi:DNA-binding response OmpR family regulator